MADVTKSRNSKYWDLLKIATINLPIGQIHGLLFIVFPLGLWYRYGELENPITIILRCIISLISCFNFELLNILSAKFDGIKDIRQNNYWIENKPIRSYIYASILQIFLAIFVSYHRYFYMLRLVLAINFTNFMYSIGRMSRNPTYKGAYAAFIAVGLHSFTMLSYESLSYDVISNHLLIFSIPWFLIDPLQDVKDSESDRLEKRITVWHIMEDVLGESNARDCLSVLIHLVMFYLYFVFNVSFKIAILFSLSGYCLVVSRYINVSQKMFDKLSWNICSFAFSILAFYAPNNCVSWISFNMVVNLSTLLTISHMALCLINLI